MSASGRIPPHNMEAGPSTGRTVHVSTVSARQLVDIPATRAASRSLWPASRIARRPHPTDPNHNGMGGALIVQEDM
jgi:hypothetical protein